MNYAVCVLYFAHGPRHKARHSTQTVRSLSHPIPTQYNAPQLLLTQMQGRSSSQAPHPAAKRMVAQLDCSQTTARPGFSQKEIRAKKTVADVPHSHESLCEQNLPTTPPSRSQRLWLQVRLLRRIQQRISRHRPYQWRRNFSPKIHQDLYLPIFETQQLSQRLPTPMSQL